MTTDKGMTVDQLMARLAKLEERTEEARKEAARLAGRVRARDVHPQHLARLADTYAGIAEEKSREMQLLVLDLHLMGADPSVQHEARERAGLTSDAARAARVAADEAAFLAGGRAVGGAA